MLWCVIFPLPDLAQRQLSHRFLHAMGDVCCRPCNEDVTELVPEDDDDFVIADGVERWVTVQTCVNYAWPHAQSPHWCPKCGAQWARVE